MIIKASVDQNSRQKQAHPLVERRSTTARAYPSGEYEQTMSAPQPNDKEQTAAVAGPQIYIQLAQPPVPPAAAAPAAAAAAASAPTESEMETTNAKKPSSRGVHILKDAEGNERKFGSALGLLTRQFIDLLHACPGAAVDINEAAQRLQVPKRRIYDITNVLEGVGMIDKRSKNVVAWKGSEAILGSTIDEEAKESMIQYRREIGSLHKEEALLDHWIEHLEKETKSLYSDLPYVETNDILRAVLESSGDPPKETLVDNEGNPQQAFLAVHTPYDGIAQIPEPSPEEEAAEGQHSEHKLYVGSLRGLEHFTKEQDDSSKPASSSKRRKIRSKGLPKRGDKMEIYMLPVELDEKTQTLKSRGAEPIPLLPSDIVVSPPASAPAGRDAQNSEAVSSSWEEMAADALGNDEGAGDFFSSVQPHGEEVQ